ncbi:D-sedoheptulose 7-phosphate isomerase [Desulfatibacillum alkenivorans DSM 16219]|jgi:D-sedoheptulose 7-phosphate isomerase|uniref:D-sedoheptulose 7-phosphate isomerase n=1 Tax=Desulfatibacillum alkenivorans DSM 16219 TaxID=1121393 RepID=A0A1M6UGP3_9BACT|nr:SIS domain-containing protein [Desulfatibacillum alkenivorans]SHK68425.1 D-sedoheptulose 7-phosphate isomerase [Desulfatibacillum alkenivorans DSM 16219]
MKLFSEQYLERLQEAIKYFPHDDFKKMIEAFLNARDSGNRIFVMGNGGSASTASHWVCDLNKGCCCEDEEKRFKMICLNDSISTMMAYANDLSYENIFIESLKNFFETGDVVVGISGSGNSPNVINAIEYANNHGGVTVGLSGYDGGKLKQIVSIPIHANVNDMQLTEDIHMIIVHMTMQQVKYSLSSN